MHPTSSPPRNVFDEYTSTPPYGGLQVPCPGASYRNSPQSSDGSLVCTPHQNTLSFLGSTRQNHDASLMMQSASAGSTNGLGLVLIEPQKLSPLGDSYEQSAPRDINDLATSLDYRQEASYDMSTWHNSNSYATEAGPSHNHLYTQIPLRSQPLAHNRSHSDNGAGVAFSSHTTQPLPPMFLPQSCPVGLSHGLTPPLPRSLSLPPSITPEYVPPTSESHWNDNPYNYLAHNYQNDMASLPSDDGPLHITQRLLSPAQVYEEGGQTSPGNEGPSTYQTRVGSERIREISRLRRTNPEKKLHLCPFPGCGATITSRHNFKSHLNSHYGIKPHACGQGECSKKFGTVAEAKRHRANHCQYRS